MVYSTSSAGAAPASSAASAHVTAWSPRERASMSGRRTARGLTALCHSPRGELAQALFGLPSDEDTGIDRATPEKQRRMPREHFSGAGWETGRPLDAPASV
ncbi:hypothetical protein KIK06_27675 [Nocardiopsis sp. EMB25]|uniref:hypothetical protein n=1 Tax=Nocardiopsis sp. EMB25 TaxID=2835867 RepID=UPI002283378E|nr:hypothetical protein [Nocardiopsis sp. EMB25]MCY9787663.1 hypothetical protein [Nocardiopsis sp. EMB25]